MATENVYKDDSTPVVQLGVTTEYPHGYVGPAVLWTGRLSALVAGGGKVKLPKGFAPASYAIRTSKVADARFSDVDAKGDPIVPGLALAEGDSVKIGVAHQTRAADGTYAAATTAAFTALKDLAVAATSGYGLVAQGAFAGVKAIADDASYAAITATGTLAGDADIEVFLFLQQVDPRPEQMF